MFFSQFFKNSFGFATSSSHYQPLFPFHMFVLDKNSRKRQKAPVLVGVECLDFGIRELCTWNQTLVL
jgi:hypothetical protein